MTRTRVKMCGITRQVDAAEAVRAGADALGLVFYEPSPRAVGINAASEALAGLPPFIAATGLFVDADAALVEQACKALPLSLLQFHGNESAQWCNGFGLPYIKALRVAPDTDMEALLGSYPGASGLLLDTYIKGIPGGTGESFDWSRIPAGHGRQLIVAGGLDAANVGAAIAAVKPYAVDVSGGIEEAPGIKSPEKMKDFVAAVQQADSQRWNEKSGN